MVRNRPDYGLERNLSSPLLPIVCKSIVNINLSTKKKFVIPYMCSVKWETPLFLKTISPLFILSEFFSYSLYTTEVVLKF